MKAQILKIAGVKNEKDFYKKFPTEEAFMAKHGAKLEKAKMGWGEAANLLAPQLGTVVGSVQQLNQQNKDLKNLDMYGRVSDMTLKAASSRPEQIKKKYIRPEDQLSQTINPLGVGTNYLAAANGAMIGGNPTEIQNTYNSPDTLYTDLGFQPLNDSNVKQYKKGGKLNKAFGGAEVNSTKSNGFDPSLFAGKVGGLGGALGSAMGKGTGRGGAASSIGSTLGSIGGSIIGGPLGGLIGEGLGGLAGGVIDSFGQNEMQQKEDKLYANLNAAGLQQGLQGVFGENKAFMKDGGWVSNDWQPQVIATFGDHKVSDLLRPPKDADMLRAGGHLREYTAPSERAMYTGREQFAMGGDLQVERGKAETMSYNPYLPEGGETVMFRGPSHENGGMPISYGENGVEVEGGEPAVVMKNGGEAEGNLVVYGNMVIPEYGIEHLDKNAKGKKFKNYIADLSKVEARQGKILNKSTNALDEIDGDDEFDQLTINSNHANVMGANMKLKEIADKKKTAAALQNAILDTAEEFGVESDALAKGKMKMLKENSKYAKFGAKLETAKVGKKVGKDKKPETFDINPSSLISQFIPELSNNSYIPNLSSQIINAKINQREQDNKMLDEVQVTAPRLKNTGMQFPSPTDEEGNYYMPISEPGPLQSRPFQQMPVNGIPLPQLQQIQNLGLGDSETEDSRNKNNWWETAATTLDSLAPYLRPSNAQALDPRQLASEMYTLGDQVQPVQAQLYNPMLQSQPYRISLQDQLNEVTAQTRAAERMAQGNPSALAMIASQGEQAKSKILGEQFRMNQAESSRSAEANRAQLNDAQLKNLGILDQQYERQEKAKSNTVLNKRAALNSIAEKFGKNKLENRTLGVMENMYNYRFGPNGQVINMNPLARLNIPDVGYGASSVNQIAQGTTPKQLRAIADLQEEQEKKATKTSKRNGAIVKAIKNL
jgi:hypothetical protein